METNTNQTGSDQRRQVLELVTEAGELMLKNGAEVSRTQQTMEIMAKSLGVEDFHGYVLTNGIFTSIGARQDMPAQVRSVPASTVHLGRVEAINQLSRRIAAGGAGLTEAYAELERIRKMPCAPASRQVLACGVGSACFAILFGGVWQDGLVALAVGLGLQLVLLGLERWGAGKLLSRFLGAGFVALVTLLIFATGFGTNSDKAIIGALMPLVPGMALTLGIRDLIDSDFLSGVIRMLDALLTAACIALGAGLVLAVENLIKGVSL